MDLRRRSLAALAAAALAASLGACSDGVRGGLPEDDAAVLQREIEDVREAVEGERCTAIEGQVRQVSERLDNLPTSVSDRLEQSLRDGVARLSETAVNECNTLTVPEVQTQPEEPAPTQEEPAPEEETPAPTQEEPAPEEETPAPEEQTPTEPAPEQPETPAPETPEGGTPAPEGDTTP